MAKVTYKPEPGTPAKHTQFGIEFGPDPVEVTDAKLLLKLRGMPAFYEVDGDDEADGLAAKHKGRGVYSIVLNGESVVDGLAKADADAFNALSDEDKAAYVEAHKA